MEKIFPLFGEVGFDARRYVKLQREELEKRIRGQLFLEVGGKLMEDYHAMRVLPGFPYDAKMQVVEALAKRKDVAFLIVVNASHLGRKIFWDRQMEYGAYALEMARELGKDYPVYFFINFWDNSERARAFRRKASALGRVWWKGPVEGYPAVDKALKAFSEGPEMAFEEDVVVVTAPGPNSGKMFAALLALYWAAQRGEGSYAKYETFPIWNLSAESPINIAYEAATAELGDYNVVDPFHLSAYGEKATNYNRDVESFRVLKPLAEALGLGYRSPTDMGVNMAGFAITDMAVCEEAARREINRRIFSYRAAHLMGRVAKKAVERVEEVARKAGVGESYREVVERAKRGDVAIRTSKGVGVKRTGDRLDAVAKAILESLKAFASLRGDVIEEKLERGWQRMRRAKLKKGRVDLTELMLTLAIEAEEGGKGLKAWQALPKLRGSDLHARYPLDRHVVSLLTRMGVGVSFEV